MKHTSKKIIALLLAVVVLVGLFPSVFAANVSGFKDVKESDWFAKFVSYVNENKLMNGVSATSFAPNATCTRAMAATVLYRIAGSPSVKEAATFSDLKAGWYKDAVAWAEDEKVVNGVGGGKFGPDGLVTREQLLAMIWRFAGSPKPEKANGIAKYPDANRVSSYAKEAFNWGIENGIINGKDGKLVPAGNATRAEFAKIISIFDEMNKAETPTEPTVAPTEPTVAPTESTVAPTESTVAPTEPTEKPTETPADPVTESYADVVRRAISERSSKYSGEAICCDIDGNGVEELIMMYDVEVLTPYGNKFPFMKTFVYTIENGRIVALIDGLQMYAIAGGPAGWAGVATIDGKRCLVVSWETGETSGEEMHRNGEWHVYTVDGGKINLESKVEYETVSNYGAVYPDKSSAIIDGVSVDYGTYRAWTEKINKIAYVSDNMSNGGSYQLEEMLELLEQKEQNEKPTEEPSEPTATQTEPTEPSEEPTEPAKKLSKVALITDYGTIDDQAYNQASWQGVVQWCEDNGAEYAYYVPSEDSTKARAACVDTAVAEGAEVVVFSGYLFGEVLLEKQEVYPDVYFVAVDVAEGDLTYDFSEYFSPTANAVCLTFAEEQAGFLAGYAAVKEGYTKLGFLGGIEVPAIVRYGYGFAQGADAAADELGVDIEINYWYSGAFMPYEYITEEMVEWYASGTQVVFACGGGIYRSAIIVAETYDGRVIGVDVDQSNESEVVLTSATKKLQNAIVMALDDIRDGKWHDKHGGKFELLSLSEGNFVGLPTDDMAWRFSNFTLEEYETVKAEIMCGDRVVDNSDDLSNFPAVSAYTVINKLN